jgi:hypothetical protein
MPLTRAIPSLILAGGMALAGGACTNPAGSAPDDGAVVLALRVVPRDVRCVRVVVTGRRTVSRAFDVTPGAAANLAMTGLPLGSASIYEEGYDAGCDGLVSLTMPVSTAVAPVSRTIVAGRPVMVEALMQRPAAVQVSALLDDAPVTLTPTARDYGDVPVGRTTSMGDFLVRNGTDHPVTVSTALAGSNPTDFRFSGCLGSTLLPGAFCVVDLFFTPTDTGVRSAFLSVDAEGSTITAALSGTGTAGIAISPSTFDFGELAVGDSSASQALFEIRNRSNHPIDVSLSVTGANAADFAFPRGTGAPASGPCGETLFAGASCAFTVVFTPAAEGQRSAFIAVAAEGSTVTTALSGTGTPGGSVTLSPTTFDFGEVAVRDLSAPVTFLIQNGTHHAVTVAASIAGADAGDFQVDTQHGCVGESLAPGWSCSVSAWFAPTATGPRNASLNVEAGPSAITAALSGTGTPAGDVTVSPTAASFGEARVGSQSAPTSFTLRNDTSHPVLLATTIEGAQASDFQNASHGCGTGDTLSPGSECLIDIVFAPTATGERAATLTVQAGATAMTVALSGTGTPAGSVTITPTMVSFGSFQVGDASGGMTFVIRNDTGNARNLTAGITGAQAADFLITGLPDDCARTLEDGQTCSLSVRFAPAATGARNAMLTVEANGTTTSALLSGTGTEAGKVTITPELASFGNVTVGSPSPVTTFTLRNDTATPFAPLAAVSGAYAGDFQIAANTCGQTLAPAGNCTIAVRFTPSATGPRAATLGTGPPGPFVALTGIGWASQDIGAVAARGGSSQASDVFTVRGSGADLFGTADEFRLVSRNITGDATLTARVVSISKTDKWTKAAVMMRAGTAANAAYAAAIATPTPGNRYRLQARTAKGRTTTSVSGGVGTVPTWLRIVRAGNKLTAFFSANGKAWTKLGATTTVTMSPTIAIGLAVTSHHDGALATAVFDNVTISQP